MSGATVRGKFRPARTVVAKPEATDPPGEARRRSQAERKARQLALPYAIERAIEAGEFLSYGEVAKALGVTQPRVSQVMSFMLLPAGVQEEMLLGSGMG